MQVQPDLEALDTSLDEEEEDSEEVEKKSAEKLGRLHYKLEYDFNKSEVGTQRTSTMDTICTCRVYEHILQKYIPREFNKAT